MKFIDVTLRDGGHQHGFNWPLEFVKRYLGSLNLFPEIEFVESVSYTHLTLPTILRV